MLTEALLTRIPIVEKLSKPLFSFIDNDLKVIKFPAGKIARVATGLYIDFNLIAVVLSGFANMPNQFERCREVLTDHPVLEEIGQFGEDVSVCLVDPAKKWLFNIQLDQNEQERQENESSQFPLHTFGPLFSGDFSFREVGGEFDVFKAGDMEFGQDFLSKGKIKCPLENCRVTKIDQIAVNSGNSPVKKTRLEVKSKDGKFAIQIVGIEIENTIALGKTLEEGDILGQMENNAGYLHVSTKVKDKNGNLKIVPFSLMLNKNLIKQYQTNIRIPLIEGDLIDNNYFDYLNEPQNDDQKKAENAPSDVLPKSEINPNVPVEIVPNGKAEFDSPEKRSRFEQLTGNIMDSKGVEIIVLQTGSDKEGEIPVFSPFNGTIKIADSNSPFNAPETGNKITNAGLVLETEIDGKSCSIEFSNLSQVGAFEPGIQIRKGQQIGTIKNFEYFNKDNVSFLRLDVTCDGAFVSAADYIPGLK